MNVFLACFLAVACFFLLKFAIKWTWDMYTWRRMPKGILDPSMPVPQPPTCSHAGCEQTWKYEMSEEVGRLRGPKGWYTITSMDFTGRDYSLFYLCSEHGKPVVDGLKAEPRYNGL